MGPDRDEAAEAEVNMSYPSPSAQDAHAGPFYPNGQDEVTAQQQSEHTQDQHHSEHVSVRDTVEKQDHDEMPQQEMNQHGAADQPPQQQHHHNHHSSNLEELQLAAQLGHNIANEPLMPATDPNMHANMDANMDENMDAHMDLEDPNLRNIMPQPENEQQHHDTSYMHDTPTSDSMISHGLSASLAAQMPSAHYGVVPELVPPRKRSKVSRACDECRRKKIKCDAQTDQGDMPCSSCSRSNIKCMFSRVPQKRGPSKGYIKELADRINSIESKLDVEGGLSHEDITTLFKDHSRLGNAGDEPNKKRPYSSISGGDFDSPVAQRQSPWAAEHRPIQPATTQAEHSGSSYTNATLAPHPAPPRHDGFEKATSGVEEAPMIDFDGLPELDEGVVQDYLGTLQILYPILPTTAEHQRALLIMCPSSLRTAFTHALLAVAQSSSGNSKLASTLLSDIESNEIQQSQSEKIVHAQTLMLLLIDADWRGSATIPTLLARAVALAGSMQLWRLTNVETDSDADSDHNLSIRIWWSIILMDRFYAVGTSKPTTIPDYTVVLPTSVNGIIGETCFHLLRLSKVMCWIARVTSSLETGVSTTDKLRAGILHDLIENFREDLPAHVEASSHPLVHLCYWHCRLVITMLNPETIPSQLLWPTRELINLLSANAEMRNPLTNHFGFLVAMALANLTKLESSAEEATNLSKSILDDQGVVWDHIREKLQDQMRPTSSAVDAATLQHLADLATAHQDVPGADEGGVANHSLAQGFLSAL